MTDTANPQKIDQLTDEELRLKSLVHQFDMRSKDCRITTAIDRICQTNHDLAELVVTGAISRSIVELTHPAKSDPKVMKWYLKALCRAAGKYKIVSAYHQMIKLLELDPMYTSGSFLCAAVRAIQCTVEPGNRDKAIETIKATAYKYHGYTLSYPYHFGDLWLVCRKVIEQM